MRTIWETFGALNVIIAFFVLIALVWTADIVFVKVLVTQVIIFALMVLIDKSQEH